MDAMLSGSGKKFPEFYDRLGCDRNSTIEQIKVEYRSRVRDCHPDKVGEEANSAFISLQRAFEILSDPQKRVVYDMWLDNPVQMNFEEFEKNSDKIKMCMHWVATTATPQISCTENSNLNSWKDHRYESELTRRFRNYEI